MRDGNLTGLYQLAMQRINDLKTSKQAYIGASEIQASMQEQAALTQAGMAQGQPGQGGVPPQPGVDPSQAPMDPSQVPMGPAAQPQPGPAMPGAQQQELPPEVYDMIVVTVRQILQDLMAQQQMPQGPETQGQLSPEAQGQQQQQGIPPEVYDVVAGAVHQVLQELGIQMEPQQQQPQEPQPKPKKPRVTPEDFAQLQADVALILQHLGLADPQGMPAEALPSEAMLPAPGAQDTGVIGAHPGMASELPPGTQGVVDPSLMVPQAPVKMGSTPAMKLAALLRGGK